ncbi:SAM-dependent methyltransferase [Burkholderia gladioli]|uniref:SAM-dependent methyltransferase n=1 Tax=Burkholderia gladioli TaxID=28095 RepID=UPI003EE1FD7F
MTDKTSISQHYDKDLDSLVERLRAALAAEGFEARQPRAADLAQLDQFHSRGLEATVELAALLEIDAATRVIDIGSGLGGPSRYLASNFGCRVEGIDLTPSFVEAARFLAQRTGLRIACIIARPTRWRCRSRTTRSTWPGPSTSR